MFHSLNQPVKNQNPKYLKPFPFPTKAVILSVKVRLFGPRLLLKSMNSTASLFVCRSSEKDEIPSLKGPGRRAEPQKTPFTAINRKALGMMSSVGVISRNMSIKGHPLLKF